LRPIDHEIEGLLYALDHLATPIESQSEDPVELDELIERAYGSKENFLDTPSYDDPQAKWEEYREQLKEDLEELSELGLVRISSEGYSVTEKAVNFSERDLELYDLDGYSKPIWVRVSQWVGKKVWQFLNRIERSSNPYKDFDAYDPGVEDDFIIAFSQRSVRYFLWVLAFTAVVALVWYFQHVDLAQGYGLGLDIFGALVLARAVIRGKANIEIESESSNLAWRQNVFERSRLDPEEAWMEAVKTVDGVWGATLLTVGFVIQIGSLHLLPLLQIPLM